MLGVYPYLLLVLGGLFLTGGDLTAKQWIQSAAGRWLVATMMLWNVGLLFLAYSFKYKNIAIASAIFVIVNIITLAVASWWLFGEPLTRKQLLGLAISLVGIAIMELE